jgi:hypothetical protein
MKTTTVAVLILMNMMCTNGYFDHASFLGTKAHETTMMANSYGSDEGIGLTKGTNLGRKLMDAGIDSSRGTESHRTPSINQVQHLIMSPGTTHP